MSRRLRFTAVACSAAGLALAATGCGGGGGGSTPAVNGPPRFVLQVVVRPAGAHVWRDTVTARPGEVLEHEVRLANVGGAQAVDVRVSDRLGAGERRVFGSGRLQPLAVSMAIGHGLPPGLFGRGALLGPLPGGGTARVIHFETVAGRQSFSEPVTLSWAGGRIRLAARVRVRP
jgi:uncharacterized repeat protein (TIGR01451 family)